VVFESATLHSSRVWGYLVAVTPQWSLGSARHAPCRSFASLLVLALIATSTIVIADVPGAEGAPLSFEDINPNNADTDATDADRASGGRVNGLAIASGNNQVIYAASEWGGLYRTTNGGLNWAHLPGHNPMATWDVEVDRSNNNRVYATSEYDGRTTGSLSGIEVSTDGGTTWGKPASATPPAAYDCGSIRVGEPAAFGISIRPDAANNVFVGTNCGVARSTDSGMSWTFIDPKKNPANGSPFAGSAQSVYDVVAQAGGIVDVCGEEGHWHSADNGATWTRGSGLPNGQCSIAASPDETYVLFAVVGTSLFSLTDAQTDANANGQLDASWQGMGPNPSSQGRIPFMETNPRAGNGGRDFNLWFGDVSLHYRNCTTPATPSPGGATRCPAPAAANNGVDDDGNGDDLNNDNTVTCPAECVDEADEGWIGRPGGLAGDQANGNRAFTRLSGAHDDSGAIVFDSAVTVDACPEVYSSDGGVYYNTDNGADCVNPNWEQPNVTPHAVWPFAMAGFNRAGNAAEDLYTSLQDNGTFANTSAGDAVGTVQGAWHIDACCDGFDVVSDGNRVVRTRCCAFSIELRNSNYTSGSTLAATNNPPGCCPSFRYPDFIQTIGDKQYIAATGQGLFVTTDITLATVTWNEIGAASSPAAGFCAVNVSFSGGTPTFYAWSGTCQPDGNNQLWTYTGTGTGDTWDRIDNNDGLAGGFGIFASDPNDPNRLYASYLGGASPRMVFSTDGGTNWERDFELETMMTGGGAYKMTTQRGPDDFSLEGGYVQPSLLAFDPEDSDVIVAGGVDSGVFVSSNGGGDWSLVTDPNSTNDTTPHLPRPRFAYFDHEPAGSVRLFVGAVGRGIWRVNLANADLSVDKSDSPDPVVAGTDLTYTINVTNGGPDIASNVVMTDSLPAQTTFQSISAPGWSCTTPAVGANGTLQCTRGSLAAGTVAIQVTVRVDKATPDGTVLSNTASVGSSAFDAAPGNNSSTETTTVEVEADLAILSYQAQSPPTELIIGNTATVTLVKRITNNGPSGPVDARLDGTASADPGATVSPTVTSSVETAVDVGEVRQVEEDYTISCQAPGPHDFTFDNEIQPNNPNHTDPDQSNNTAQESFAVECIVPVAINIKPGSFKNPINLKSKGVIPVAVLTTAAGEYGLPLAFDATTILPLTVRFGPEPVVIAGGGAREAHGRGHVEDAIERSDEVTKDGDLDMVLHFRTQESELTGTETKACVRGEFGPMHFIFHGCDLVTFVP
jgi:uncharacterized repeat protein (TIGR01451 family)